MYAFVLEKPLRLVGRNFCLAISFVFASASLLILNLTHSVNYKIGLDTRADDVLMCTLGRVSVARMVTVKPHGWVYASLERGCMSTSFPKWSGLNHQIIKRPLIRKSGPFL